MTGLAARGASNVVRKVPDDPAPPVASCPLPNDVFEHLKSCMEALVQLHSEALAQLHSEAIAEIDEAATSLRQLLDQKAFGVGQATVEVPRVELAAKKRPRSGSDFVDARDTSARLLAVVPGETIDDGKLARTVSTSQRERHVTLIDNHSVFKLGDLVRVPAIWYIPKPFKILEKLDEPNRWLVRGPMGHVGENFFAFNSDDLLPFAPAPTALAGRGRTAASSGQPCGGPMGRMCFMDNDSDDVPLEPCNGRVCALRHSPFDHSVVETRVAQAPSLPPQLQANNHSLSAAPEQHVAQPIVATRPFDASVSRIGSGHGYQTGVHSIGHGYRTEADGRATLNTQACNQLLPEGIPPPLGLCHPALRAPQHSSGEPFMTSPDSYVLYNDVKSFIRSCEQQISGIGDASSRSVQVGSRELHKLPLDSLSDTRRPCDSFSIGVPRALRLIALMFHSKLMFAVPTACRKQLGSVC